MVNGLGWISLHRQISEHWLWKEKRVFSKAEAWIDILLSANHKDNKTLLGNELITVKRGSFITSEIKLMNKWSWSKSKVRAFLCLMQDEKMIEKISDNKKTTINVVRYCDYQVYETTKKPVKDFKKTSKELQKDTNNNDNNYNNDNNKEYIYTGFLNWFNSRKEKHLSSKGRFKVLTKTDVNNYKKLKAQYSKEDFEVAIKNLFKSKWALENNMCTPSHFLRVENFNKYLNLNTNDKKILNA